MMTLSNEAIKKCLKENALFKGFSDHQLDVAVSLTHELNLQTGETIIREGEINDHIYLIHEGEVEIFKHESDSKQNFSIAKLYSNEVIGEITLLDHEPRSATVRASKPTTLLAISADELRSVSAQDTTYEKVKQLFTSEQPIFTLMVRNLAKGLGQRMRNTNEAVVDALSKELQYTIERISMGYVIISVLVMIALYMIVMKLFEEGHFHVITSSIISMPMIIIFACSAIFVIFKSKHPIQRYGLTLKNWKISLIEASMMGLLIVLASILTKWIFIHVLPSYAHRAFFDGELITHQLSYDTLALILVLYIILVPLQELIARGLLQGSFEDFLTGRHRTITAILLSNLLFSMTHLHYSLSVVLVVFLSGLAWGWIYYRHRTLVGVALSHTIVGIWSLFFLGI